jgi:hypothetical protein
MEEKEKIVRVFVRGGCVTEVDNLPEDYDWKIIDYDCRDDTCNDDKGECGSCDKAETCFTYSGSPTCKWILYKEERERREREAEKIKKIEADRQKKLDRLSEVFKDIREKYNVPHAELNELCELERVLGMAEEQP